MKNFEGIIFDVDGTLTSTNELIFASFNHLAKIYLNKTLTNEEIISLFGPTEDVIIKNWCGSEYETGRKAYYDFYADNHEMADLYPGMEEVLALVKSKEIPCAIFTGKGRESTIISMEKLGTLKYFDYIVTGDDVVKHKPSGEGIMNIIDKLNLDKEKVLMIGDSPSDIIASHEAGVKVASVVWDSYAIDEVLKMNSDYVFHTVKELKDFLNENL